MLHMDLINKLCNDCNGKNKQNKRYLLQQLPKTKEGMIIVVGKVDQLNHAFSVFSVIAFHKHNRVNLMHNFES